MGYTNFSLSKAISDISSISLEDLKQGKKIYIMLQIANTGVRKGSTVVQLYVRDELASRLRPLRTVRAFRKVVLSAEETKEITLFVGYEDLGSYLRNGKFTVEKGKLIVYIGENCLTNKSIEIVVY